MRRGRPLSRLLVGLLAALAPACTLTLHRDESVRAAPAPAPDPRPVVRLRAGTCAPHWSHWNDVIRFEPEEPLRGSALDELRTRWEASGCFARVLTADEEHVVPDIEVRLRVLRDQVERTPSGPTVLYLWPVAVPLLLIGGSHADAQLVWDARFERGGVLLAEITRVERLSEHRHWLFLPFAWLLPARGAEREAEKDLLRGILGEARRRKIL